MAFRLELPPQQRVHGGFSVYSCCPGSLPPRLPDLRRPLVAFLLRPRQLSFVAKHFGIRLSFGAGVPLIPLSLPAVHALGTRPVEHAVT